MKIEHTIFTVLGFIASCCIFISISSCESPDCGELTGYWLLTRVDTLATNQSVNYRENQVAWSFEGKIMETYKGDGYFYMYRFSHSGDQLKITEPFLIDRINGDHPMTQEKLGELAVYGINNLEEDFNIEVLNHKEMRLNNGELRLYFQKY